MPTSGTLDIIVVIQKNKTRHLINRLQIEQFGRTNNRDTLIFPIKDYQLKRDGRNLIQNELLFNA